MKLVGSRMLRGPNVDALEPCFAAFVDLEALDGVSSIDVPGFNERLYESLPGLHAGFVEQLRQGTSMANVLQHVVIELQQFAGNQVLFGCNRPLAGAPRQHRIACAYRHEAVVEQAMALALRLVDALVAGEAFDLQLPVATLRLLVQSRAIDAASEALLEAAARRGIPALRLEDDKRLFQLGWGRRQRRLEAGQRETAITTAAIAAGCATAADARIRSMFDRSHDGRIPVIAITGTNGKTTTTQLVAHALRQSAYTVGATTTQGVLIDGRIVEHGDCTGYWSARTVLTSPEVDMAVLETARGGILKRGLAFDRCDVGVVLNVSGDHLGLDGVETLADLAHVKGLVARCAGSAAVLNADDEHCVAMAEQLQPGCRAVWFSLSASNALVRSQVERGGQAAWVEEGWLMLADGTGSKRLLPTDRIPISMGGHARYNVANALAAAAALMCIGLDRRTIISALAGFVSNARNNPLRSNQFDVGGVKLILDYAHNLAAYRALCNMARSMLQGGGGRLVGVVTSPGDRRAGDLFEVGAACGEGFDELVVYEQDPRGRDSGETTNAILAGARSTAPDKPLHGEPRIVQALARGLRIARPGDLLVFTCAGTLDDVIAGVRTVDAASADRLAADIAA